MHVRDASGRQVSLLNDEPAVQPMRQRPNYYIANPVISQPFRQTSRSNSSSPHTPELLRSDSYDSNASNDPLSPMTPTSYDPSRISAFPGHAAYEEQDKRGAYRNTSRANSCEEDSSVTSPLPERPGKRYPCRYRDSHGCEKTFTTSGHASRHSKIHTAEKAVQCTFHGCQKKFTRADNMKQHLETHFKDKSRSTASAKQAARSPLGALPCAARRPSSSSSARVAARAPRNQPVWEGGESPYGYPAGQLPLPSPSATSPWELRAFNLPPLGRTSDARTPSSGLDALAMAVACQEGA